MTHTYLYLICISPQGLEGELWALQGALNASLQLTEQFDILQRRVVLLEDIFLRLSGKASHTRCG